MGSPIINVAITATTGQATAAIEDFRARSSAAVQAYGAAAKESAASSKFLTEQMKSLSASGVAVVPAMEQAVAALEAATAATSGLAQAQAVLAASTSASRSESATAAYAQMVDAQAANLAMTKALRAEYVKLAAAGTVTEEGMATLIVEEHAATESSTMLSLAKANLADTLAYEAAMAETASGPIVELAGAETAAAVASAASSSGMRQLENATAMLAARAVGSEAGMGMMGYQFGRVAMAAGSAASAMGPLLIAFLAIAAVVGAVDLYEDYEKSLIADANAAADLEHMVGKANDALMTQQERLAGITSGPMAKYQMEIGDIGKRSLDMTASINEVSKDLEKQSHWWSETVAWMERYSTAEAVGANGTMIAAPMAKTYSNNELESFTAQLNKEYTTQAQLPAAIAAIGAELNKVHDIETAAAQAEGGYNNAFVQGIELRRQHLQDLYDVEAKREKTDTTQAKADAGEHLKSGKGAGAAPNYADILAAQQLEQGKSLGATVLYWEAVVEKTGKYHEELLRAEEAFQKEIAGKGKLGITKNPLGPEPPSISQSDLTSRKPDEQLVNEQLRAQQQQAQTTARVREATIAYEEQAGKLTKVGADQAIATTHAAEYASELAAIKGQLSTLTGGQADYVFKLTATNEQLREYLRLQTEQANVKGQSAVAQIKDTGKTATDIAAPYIKATDTINQSWLEMQNKLIFGTRNVGVAFRNMGVSMLESVAASFEKMLVKQIQYGIRSEVMNRLAEQQKLVTKAQATAAGEGIDEGAYLKQELKTAKLAAKNAFESVLHAVPFPFNVILAPIAAAGAFAAVMAFEQGGIIPNTGIALVHGGEGVLPKNLTTMLTSVANSHSTSSSSSTVNSTANFNGITGRNFREMAHQHSDAVADAVHTSLRSGSRRR